MLAWMILLAKSELGFQLLKKLMIFKNLTKYFRQSLIDSDRLSPSDKDILDIVGVGKSKKTGNYVSVNKGCWVKGSIDQSVAQYIIDVKSTKADKELKSVEVLLIPRIDFLYNQFP